MKKTISWWVVFALLLTLLGGTFAACGQREQNTETPAENTPTEPVPTEPDEDTQEPQTWDGINAASFVSYMQDFQGEVDGVSFQGVLLESQEYQPKTYLSAEAIKAIRQYARANDFNGLRIHAHVTQSNNAFLIGDDYIFSGAGWTVLEISLGELYTFTPFWSQSEGATQNYLWFEFIQLPVINKYSFTGAVTPFTGTVGEETFDGFLFQSADYQPTTYFTTEALEDIREYAEANGFNALRVSAYPIQKDNSFVIGGAYYSLDRWTSVDFSIADMTMEAMYFWSQSQGLTENYLRFEFVNSDAPVVPKQPSSGAPAPSGNPYFRSDRAFGAGEFTGEVGGVEFTGVKLTSSEYQPTFYFTNKSLSEIRKAADEQGMNFLRIHSYAILHNNGFIVGNAYTGPETWYTTEIPIESLGTSFSFWSQSEGLTEIYLRFELFRLDVPEKEGPINASFFEGVNCNISFADYMGVVDGQTINGVQIKSADYQPYFRFTQEGIAAVLDYAAATGKNFITVHSYAILYNNGLIVSGNHTPASQWSSTRLYVEDLADNNLFWSQSEGATEIYLWFSWESLEIPETQGPIDSTFFRGVNCNVSVQDYKGVAGGETINGVQVRSSDYQPRFAFTQTAVDAIKAYGDENDYNTLIIHSYPILTNNMLVINGIYTGADTWTTTRTDIASLSTDFTFRSDSEGSTEVYLWFEFGKSGLIHSGSFTGGCSFADYTGEVGGVSFAGIKATSSAYQPRFTFTAGAVSNIQAYAEANGYNTLIVHSYPILTNNHLVVNGSYTSTNAWTTTKVDVSALTTDFTFRSDSEGLTEVYLWFEFGQSGLIHSGSFTGGCSFADYTGEVGGVSFAGIKATSSAYQPSFYFTETAINEIKAYASANGYNALTIHAYPVLTNNALITNGTYCPPNNWSSVKIETEALSTDFKFWSQSEGTTEVYLWFAFGNAALINSGSFTGSYTFADYTGEVGGVSINGIKATSGTYQPRFTFTAGAVSNIQAYAEANGCNTLIIHSYPILTNNQLVVNGSYTSTNAWATTEVDVSTLTTDFTFRSDSEGLTEVYLWFEFGSSQ